MNSWQSMTLKNLPASEIRKIFNAALGMDDVIHFEIGDPDFNTPEHIIEAAHKAARDGFTHYTATPGLMETREVIARKLEEDNGIKVDPASQVIVTVGGVGAVFSACLSMLEAGDQVLITDPNWPNYKPQVLITGAVPVMLPLREKLGFSPDLVELRKRITAKTKVLIINSPNNPTGGIFSRDTLMAIGNIAVENGILVISDEVYEKITYDGIEHFSLGSVPEFKDNVLTVNSLSKTYAMTGWRMGYAAGPANVIAGMVKVQEASSACVSAVVQKAGIAAITGDQEPVRQMVSRYSRRRDFMAEGLNSIPGFGCLPPAGAFYVFPKVKDFGMTSYDLALALLKEAKVATVHGSGFGRYGEGYLRMSFATSDEQINEGLERIRKFAEANFSY